MFYSTKGVSSVNHKDVNYEVVLRNCNGKLIQWADTWQREMQRGMCLIAYQVWVTHVESAGGESFHFSFLRFFRLHVKLFLNSFGIQASMSPVRLCCLTRVQHH
jgi:hypothetical protein